MSGQQPEGGSGLAMAGGTEGLADPTNEAQMLLFTSFVEGEVPHLWLGLCVAGTRGVALQVEQLTEDGVYV